VGCQIKSNNFVLLKGFIQSINIIRCHR
jgi:hypothetical protein